MNISEQYVKMCDCEEIQGNWIAEHGDYYVKKGYQVIDILESILVSVNVLNGIKQQSTWLPRQDQLQILSGLSWQEFDKECRKYDAETKEQAGIQVVIKRLDKTTQ